MTKTFTASELGVVGIAVLAGCASYAGESAPAPGAASPADHEAVATTPAPATPGVPSGCARHIDRDDASGELRIAVDATAAQQCLSPDAVARYVFTAPDDAAGGWVQIDLARVAGPGLSYRLVAEVDESEIFGRTEQAVDAPLQGFVTVARGATYRLEVEQSTFETERTVFDLVLAYQPFRDAFEPNDTRDTAKPIALGQPVTGFVPVGEPGRSRRRGSDDFDDWYGLTLSAAATTITVSGVEGLEIGFTLWNADGEIVDSAFAPTEGADARVLTTRNAGGAHTLQIRAHDYYTRMSGDGPAPAYLTRPYTLTVTQ